MSVASRRRSHAGLQPPRDARLGCGNEHAIGVCHILLGVAGKNLSGDLVPQLRPRREQKILDLPPLDLFHPNRLVAKLGEVKFAQPLGFSDEDVQPEFRSHERQGTERG